MKYIFTIGLLLSLVCCFVVSDVSAHDPHEHSMVDIRNAAKEQKRLNDLVVEYIIERNRYISLVNDMKVIGGGKVGSMQTILISSLSSAMKTTLANAAGLTVRAYISANGTSSLADAIDSAISSANTYHGMATYLYSNPTRLDGYDAANSALEANMDGREATDHHNAYHTSLTENPPNRPTDPGDLDLPWFECPGTCTQEYPTVSEAINAHYEKCDDTAEGNTEPVSSNLSHTRQREILSNRDVKEGCGVAWYSCDSDHLTNEAYHRIRTCVKDHTNSNGVTAPCGVDYRNCLFFERDHNENDIWTFKSAHSDVAESNSPVASPTPTPTDGTPNCPDCTTHCSSPCLCTNSGTCNGSMSYHACGQHETSVSGDHSNGTYTCSIHSGYKCQESHDHKTYISSCTQTDSNGNTCTNSSGYYECSQHSHTYPPSLVACGGAAWTGCTTSVSSRTEHKVESCSNCGNHYWTCMSGAVDRHTNVLTCKRSGCRMSLTRCQNGPEACTNERYHWF